MTAFLTRPESPEGVPKPVLSWRRSVAGLITIRAWVWQVRWPTPQRLARLAKPRDAALVGS